jgi:hypothetical protein
MRVRAPIKTLRHILKRGKAAAEKKVMLLCLLSTYATIITL